MYEWFVVWFLFLVELWQEDSALETGRQYFPLLRYSSVIKAFDLLQTKEGIECGLSDGGCAPARGLMNFKGLQRRSFRHLVVQLGFTTLATDTCLLVAVVTDGAEGAWTPCARLEQN